MQQMIFEQQADNEQQSTGILWLFLLTICISINNQIAQVLIKKMY